MKYICTKNELGLEEIFLFPSIVDHDTMMEGLTHLRNRTTGQWKRVYREPVSAGFVNESWTCHGESVTLRLKSREEDTDILRSQLF